MKKVDDYGGNTKGRSRVPRKKKNLQSHRCMDCDRLQYLNHREAARAARPRCKHCGGALNELSVSKERRGITSKSTDRPRRRRCPCCGSAIQNNETMCAHLMAFAECKEYVIANRNAIHVSFPGACGEGLLPMTVYFHGSKAKWKVLGMLSSGRVVEVAKFKHKYECEDFIREHLGPVELSR